MAHHIDPFPKTGDIVLMNAKPAIIAAQSAIRWRRARFSHAAMTIDDHGYVDSLTGRGIGVAYWADLDPAMPIRAFRHRPTAANSPERLAQMLEHYGKAYNFAFAAKSHPILKRRYADAFYCSEYVGQVFTYQELGVDPKQPLVMPVDLERLAANPDWDDVTEVYKDIVGRPYVDASGFSNTRLFERLGQVNVGIRGNRKAHEEALARADELMSTINGFTSTFAKLAREAGKPGR